jgi:hypothetical protein
MALNLPKPDVFRCSWELILCRFGQFRESRNRLANLVHGEETRRESIIDVSGVVSNLISQVDELGFERRATPGKKVLQLGSDVRIEFPGVFDDALPDLKRQVQAIKACIPPFELIDNPQGVPVVLKRASKLAHLPVQFPFADVRERRMAEIMRECECFGIFLVQLERRTYRPSNLRDLDGVGQPIAEVVAQTGREYLCLPFQTAKSARVNDAVTVALKIISERVRRFGKLSTAKIRRTQAKSAEHQELLLGLGSELLDSARDSGRLIGASQRLKQLLRFSGIGALERLSEKQLGLCFRNQVVWLVCNLA